MNPTWKPSGSQLNVYGRRLSIQDGTIPGGIGRWGGGSQSLTRVSLHSSSDEKKNSTETSKSRPRMLHTLEYFYSRISDILTRKTFLLSFPVRCSKNLERKKFKFSSSSLHVSYTSGGNTSEFMARTHSSDRAEHILPQQLVFLRLLPISKVYFYNSIWWNNWKCKTLNLNPIPSLSRREISLFFSSRFTDKTIQKTHLHAETYTIHIAWILN